MTKSEHRAMFNELKGQFEFIMEEMRNCKKTSEEYKVYCQLLGDITESMQNMEGAYYASKRKANR